MGRSELGDFLRARRGQLVPQQVGLRDSGRRRTPGLRREEVASIAGVSIDYLVRLEQGREKNPSVGVLSALAEALLLSEEEHRHLYTLAALAHDEGPCVAAEKPSDQVAPTVRAVLDHVAEVPAYVVGPYGDALHWNVLWGRLASPLGLLDDRYERNLIRFTFLDPAARVVIPDWSPAADEYVTQLRSAFLHWRHDERLAHLIEELRQSPEFTRRWDAHPVLENLRGTRRLQHPRFGALNVAYETLSVADDGQRLVCWLAADQHTAAVYARLAHGPDPLDNVRLGEVLPADQ